MYGEYLHHSVHVAFDSDVNQTLNGAGGFSNIGFAMHCLSPSLPPSHPSFFHRKKNRFPLLDILGYLKNTHKNPKFGKVRQVPQPGNSQPSPLVGDLSHSSKFGILVGILKYPKISKNGNLLFFPVFRDAPFFAFKRPEAPQAFA